MGPFAGGGTWGSQLRFSTPLSSRDDDYGSRNDYDSNDDDGKRLLLEK